MTVKSLKKHKDDKLNKKIVEDLENSVKIMNLSLQGLSHFSKYRPVMEAISTLQSSKTLLEIHLNKYKRSLEDKDETKN